MSLLRELLQAKEPLFDESLRQLEAASHKQGVDISLTADIYKNSSRAMRQLGLDPGDTTGAELYGGLVGQAKKHDQHLAKRIGVRSSTTAQGTFELIKDTIAAVPMPRDVWVLKKSVAKDMLRHMPPQHIMKLLGYRSVDSMLKRESLATLYGALRFVESPDWLNAFNMRYTKLAPTDFETRPIEIVVLPVDPWAKAAAPFIVQKRHNITHAKEVGIIVMLPLQTPRADGLTLWATGLLLHYINEIRLYSTFFKLQQVKKNFGNILAHTLIADPDLGPVMAGQNIHWRVIQRYFGKSANHHPEIFEPHVQPEDLHWRQAEETLFAIDPELGFWKDLDYVAVMPRQESLPVSFNLLDVVASFSNKTLYKNREVYHFRESLWNEIFMRYMGQQTLRQQVLSRLDNDMIAPESLDRI